MARRFYKVTVLKKGKKYTEFKTTGTSMKDVVKGFTKEGKAAFKAGKVKISPTKPLFN